MAVNFKLNPVFALDRAVDPMSRSWVGWSPELTDQEVYEQNRGVWHLGRRAELERYATFSFEGIVRLVVAIDHIETIPAKVAGEKDRRAIVGTVLREGDPIRDSMVSRPVDSHRNPVTYIPDPAGARTCGCGCGAVVAGSRAFLPGHDQRAVHDRITRQWGSTVSFIAWFDENFPDGD